VIDPGGEGVEFGGGGAGGAGGRHFGVADFIEDVFPDVAFGEGLLGVAEAGEVEVGVLEFVVVAGDAALGEEGGDVALEGLAMGRVGLGEEGEGEQEQVPHPLILSWIIRLWI